MGVQDNRDGNRDSRFARIVGLWRDKGAHRIESEFRCNFHPNLTQS
jgi:hypothetical protein